MSQLAFFPWFAAPAALAAGPVRLIPYERGVGPSTGVEQAALDAVLEPYKGPGGKPVQTATILTIEHRPITADLSDEALDDFFQYAELIAFAGLAARPFFDGLQYCGRDDFRLTIQSFEDPHSGPLVTTRRRDGVTKIHYASGTYSVSCPQHVGGRASTIDLPLLCALVASGPESTRALQALTLFNEANTDRAHTLDVAEMVLTFAAFEQLLDSRAQPRILAERFQAAWATAAQLDKAYWTLVSPNERVTAKFRLAPSLRFAWLEDMAILRGSVGHGHGTEAYPSVWSAREHLLLAAFAFPRLVKLQLSAAGKYSLTEDDLADLDCLDNLLNARHFAERHETEDHPWNDSLGQARMNRIALNAAKAMGIEG